ncbi:hypothetical protein EVAR_63964_1 [Eumeta japonica]|uniref:ATP-dependent DNA helicase n=1 Tax=Eumeta variegata TaxID=151549 RepID=A0A4C1ZXA3_EUMVA|nr:hypothetical protein EVAR_63964_1 [Eumeta japonica]
MLRPTSLRHVNGLALSEPHSHGYRHEVTVSYFAFISVSEILYFYPRSRQRTADGVESRECAWAAVTAYALDLPRHVNEKGQDAMTYVRKCKIPDLFVTFTCNLELSGLHVLIMIEDTIHEMCDESLTDFVLPVSNKNNSNRNMDPLEEALRKPYDLNKLSDYISENEPKLVVDQLTAYSCVLNSVRLNEGNIYFWMPLVELGKAFVTNLILAKIRSREKLALAVASSAISSISSFSRSDASPLKWLRTSSRRPLSVTTSIGAPTVRTTYLRQRRSGVEQYKISNTTLQRYITSGPMGALSVLNSIFCADTIPCLSVGGEYHMSDPHERPSRAPAASGPAGEINAPIIKLSFRTPPLAREWLNKNSIRSGRAGG